MVKNHILRRLTRRPNSKLMKQAGQHLLVRASVEAYSNLTYVLEYVEVLERNRGLYRYGVHFDPEYTAGDISVQIGIEDSERIKTLRPIPRQSAKVRGQTKVRFSKDYHKESLNNNFDENINILDF